MLGADYVVGTYKVVFRTQAIWLVELSRTSHDAPSLFDSTLDEPAIFHDSYITGAYKLLQTTDAYYLLEIQKSDEYKQPSLISLETDGCKSVVRKSPEKHGTTPDRPSKKQKESLSQLCLPGEKKKPQEALATSRSKQAVPAPKRPKNDTQTTNQPLITHLDVRNKVHVPTTSTLEQFKKNPNECLKLCGEYIMKWSTIEVDDTFFSFLEDMRRNMNLVLPARLTVRCYDAQGKFLSLPSQDNVEMIALDRGVVLSVRPDRFFVAYTTEWIVIRINRLQFKTTWGASGCSATAEQIVPIDMRFPALQLPVENIFWATDYLSRDVLERLFSFSPSDFKRIPRFDSSKYTIDSNAALYLELQMAPPHMLWRSPIGFALHSKIHRWSKKWRFRCYDGLKRKASQTVSTLPQSGCEICVISEPDVHVPSECQKDAAMFLSWITKLETWRCEKEFNYDGGKAIVSEIMPK